MLQPDPALAKDEWNPWPEGEFADFTWAHFEHTKHRTKKNSNFERFPREFILMIRTMGTSWRPAVGNAESGFPALTGRETRPRRGHCFPYGGLPGNWIKADATEMTSLDFEVILDSPFTQEYETPKKYLHQPPRATLGHANTATVARHATPRHGENPVPQYN
ncbi:hypothetical protein K438DRAFT_1761808 [Mycena galopus ATCC 62051]|nr:hypothetical protein K438DRAFT_1761808 [Mycena galopus ATCC 62051]